MKMIQQSEGRSVELLVESWLLTFVWIFICLCCMKKKKPNASSTPPAVEKKKHEVPSTPPVVEKKKHEVPSTPQMSNARPPDFVTPTEPLETSDLLKEVKRRQNAEDSPRAEMEDSAVARRGGGKFKLVMIQSIHRFGLAASSPNLSESSLAGWVPVLGFAALTLGPFGPHS